MNSVSPACAWMPAQRKAQSNNGRLCLRQNMDSIIPLSEMFDMSWIYENLSNV